MMNRVGQRLGNYRLLRLLGRGGFAEVYLGEHVFLRTLAAIKVLSVRLAEEEMEAFLNEARTIAGLTHPNILRVLEFGVEDNVPFLVMEYATNGTLRQRHPKGSVLPLSVVLPYVRQIASSLQYVHNKKMIHRDIKPENLLLSPTYDVLLSDFGTALVVQTQHNLGTLEMAGTVAYMAPEQIRGKPRPASDQYCLAIVVYEWLCGTVPFVGSFTEQYSQHMFATPLSMRARVPAIPSDVEQVVMMALAKNPEQRFANVAAFANALEQASQPEQGFIIPPSVVASRPLAPIPGPYFNTLSSQQELPTLAPGVSDPGRTPIITPSTFETLPTLRFAPAAPQSSNLSQSAPAPGPVIPPPVIKSEPPRRHSRRALLIGLLGLGAVVVAGGAGTWLVLEKHGSASANPGTPTATPAPGTTIVVYKGHTKEVYTVAWGARSGHIASGGKDNKARVWDPLSPSGKDIFAFIEHSGSVNALAWSPNGQRVASASSDTTVRVWDATTGNQTVVYGKHAANVRAVAWSPYGNLIASGGDDNMVHVWEAATGKQVFAYKHHTGMIWSLSWSPNGARIASASVDKTVQVWDATTGANAFTFTGHSTAVKAVAWSPDGHHIASGSDVPESHVRVWDATTRQPLITYTEHTGGVYSLAWSFNGQHIASSSWQEVRIWEPLAPSGRTVNTYTAHTGAVHAVSWSPDGKQVASGADDTTVRVWQAI